MIIVTYTNICKHTIFQIMTIHNWWLQSNISYSSEVKSDGQNFIDGDKLASTKQKPRVHQSGTAHTHKQRKNVSFPLEQLPASYTEVLAKKAYATSKDSVQFCHLCNQVWSLTICCMYSLNPIGFHVGSKNSNQTAWMARQIRSSFVIYCIRLRLGWVYSLPFLDHMALKVSVPLRLHVRQYLFFCLLYCVCPHTRLALLGMSEVILNCCKTESKKGLHHRAFVRYAPELKTKMGYGEF